MYNKILKILPQSSVSLETYNLNKISKLKLFIRRLLDKTINIMSHWVIYVQSDIYHTIYIQMYLPNIIKMSKFNVDL